MRGQEVSFAESVPDHTIGLETGHITFGVAHNDKGLGFHPLVETADVQLPALEQLRGRDSSASVKYNVTYLQQGFSGTNVGQVYMEMLEPLPLDFHGDTERAGAFISPSLDVIALSRLTGIVGGSLNDDSLQIFIDGNFRPDKFFRSVKLLGSVDIKDHIKKVDGFPTQVSVRAKVPSLKYRKAKSASQGTQIEALFEWVADGDTGALEFKVDRITTTKQQNTAPGSLNFTCKVKDYHIQTGYLDFELETISYQSATDAPPTAQVQPRRDGGVPQLNLLGEFGLLAEFRKYLLPQVTADLQVVEGVLLFRLRFHFPDIQFGVFSLSNATVDTLFSIGNLDTTLGEHESDPWQLR
jgi:hypothetical protein